MRRSIVLVAVALATPAAPAGAATGSFEVGRLAGSTAPSETIPVFSGPRPAADRVAFASGSAARGWSIRLGSPGMAQREVAAIAPEPGASLGLLASPTRLAAVLHASVCGKGGCDRYTGAPASFDAALAGPLAGPLATLAQCRPAGGGCAPSSCLYASTARYRAALDGDLLALRDGCTSTVELHDLASGVTRSLGPAAAAAAAIAVAGSFVATLERSTTGPLGTIVIRDAATASEVYRAPADVSEPLLALLADGTAVHSTVVSGRRLLVASTPAAPAGRVLRALPPGTAIAGSGAGAVLLATPIGDPGGSRLELVRVDGGPSPAGLILDELVGAVGFDGGTVMWAQRRCVTTVVTSWRLGEPAPARPDLRCPSPVPSRAAVTLPRSRRLSVVLACPGDRGRGGCLSTVALTAIRRGRLARGLNGAERLWMLGRAGVALDPGERAAAELLVPRDAARWLRRHAPLRLRIEVRSDAGGRRSLVRRTVALRVAR